MDKVLFADHRLKFEVQYLTNDVNALKKSLGDRNSELDKLYTENDRLKDSINYYNTQFDFEQIKKNEKTLDLFNIWGEKVKQWSEKIYASLKDSFQCNLCSGQAVQLTTLKCEHVFCAECLRKNHKRPDCSCCCEPKKDPTLNRFAIELLKLLEPLKDHNVKLMNEYEALQKFVPESILMSAKH